MEKIYVKTVIFDLDGTLIDSKRDIIDSLNAILTQMGLEAKAPEVIRGYIGLGRDKLVSDALGRSATPAMVDKANQVFEEYYRKHMFDNTRPFDGVIDVLEYLRDKELMIVTNKASDLTIETLKRFNIEKYFNKVVGGEHMNCRKPDPCPINNFLSGTNIRKNEAIMVGDSDIDVKTGKLAGILTCGMTYGIGRREDIEKAEPDYILDDIRKLKDIVK